MRGGENMGKRTSGEPKMGRKKDLGLCEDQDLS